MEMVAGGQPSNTPQSDGSLPNASDVHCLLWLQHV
jgi:hypothetical protein